MFDRMPEFQILLINTRVPRSTKQLVEGVRQKHDRVRTVMLVVTHYTVMLPIRRMYSSNKVYVV